MWEYKFVPFTAVVPHGKASGPTVANDFGTLVRAHTLDAWEYYRLDTFPTLHPPGCIAGLLGAQPTIVPITVAVFRRALAR